MSFTKKSLSLKSRWYSFNSKKILIGIGVIVFVAIGTKAYLKNSIQKWSEAQQIKVSAHRWKVGWGTHGPKIIFKKVEVRNQLPLDSFQKLFIEKVTLELLLGALIKNYFRTYDIVNNLEEIRIEEKSGSYTEIKKGSFVLVGNYPIYKIREVKAETIDIALTEEYATPLNNPDNKGVFSHLPIYYVTADMEYHAYQQTLILDIHIPPATNQMPEAATYSVHAYGKLHILDYPFPVSPKKVPLPLRGLIKVTVNNFSHFLTHLHQAQIISLITDNLGSIVGYPVPKEDIQLEQKEILTNAVILDLEVKPEAVDIGGFKIYP